MIFLAHDYRDLFLYQSPLQLDSSAAESDLFLVLREVVKDWTFNNQVDGLGNTYSAHSLTGSTSPTGLSLSTVTLLQVVKDLLSTPASTYVWGVRPPFGLRGVDSSGQLTDIAVVLSNSDAVALDPGDGTNPYTGSPLIVYDPTDDDGTRVSKEGDPADHAGTEYWICNPAIFSLVHELAHAWHVHFAPIFNTFDQLEAFAQRIENEFRIRLGYRRRKIPGSTIIGKQWTLCKSSDTEQEAAAPEPPVKAYSWCFVANACGLNLDNLRSLRAAIATRSWLIRAILVQLFDEYYEISVDVVTGLHPRDVGAARVATRAMLRFWSRMWRVPGVCEDVASVDETGAALAWLDLICPKLRPQGMCWWALNQAARAELTGELDLNDWWRQCPLIGHGGAYEDPAFDAEMAGIGSPIRAQHLRVEVPALPHESEISIRFAGSETIVSNRGTRNIFVSVSKGGEAIVGDFDEVSLLAPGKDLRYNQPFRTLFYSYQPRYDGINCVLGLWSSAQSLHPVFPSLG